MDISVARGAIGVRCEVSLDTSSFPAYLRSLNLTVPVTTKAGRILAGPPAPVLEFALRLGLGPWVFDSARNRGIAARLGVGAEDVSAALRRLRSRSMWRQAWEDLARPHISAGEEALARGDDERAAQELRLALNLVNLAYGGDHYYFHTPARELAAFLQVARQLYGMLCEISGERVERISVSHPHGTTTGLLHFPPPARDGVPASTGRLPALLAIHGLGGSKESFDYQMALFREAGYATFCIDMPAQGENFDGPRLQPDDEGVGVAALEALAGRPEIDAARVGVMGASLGAFYALRTAAATPGPRVCLAHASPFDIGAGLKDAVPGIQEYFAWVIGAPTLQEAYLMAKPYHLYDVLGSIRCPVRLVYGTQDHICNFMASYEIARRLSAPVSVHALVGVDHEAANPSTPPVARPGMEWLKENL